MAVAIGGDRAFRSREEELERALDSGGATLPPNKVRGILGETAADLRKAEDFAPDLNSGISQENDWPVVWLLIILAYLVFFPVAYVILWRTRYVSRRTKIAVSIVGAVGVVAVAVYIASGR